jgi:hypothetical protein
MLIERTAYGTDGVPVEFTRDVFAATAPDRGLSDIEHAP